MNRPSFLYLNIYFVSYIFSTVAEKVNESPTVVKKIFYLLFSAKYQFHDGFIFSYRNMIKKRVFISLLTMLFKFSFSAAFA